MSVSFRGSDGFAGLLKRGAPLQSRFGLNTTASTRVFPSRSVFEEVPGSLRCTLTPYDKDNQVEVRCHLAWGGWTRTSTGIGTFSGIDVSALFRIYKSINNGASWTIHGQYSPSENTSISGSIGIATGCYKYNQGDTNSSFDSDDILVVDSAGSTSPTIFALFWACGYEANSRTIYWNRSINTGNSYNPTHTCTIVATEIKK